MGYVTTYCFICALPCCSDGFYQIGHPDSYTSKLTESDIKWIKKIIFLTKTKVYENVEVNADVGGGIFINDDFSICNNITNEDKDGFTFHKNCYTLLTKVIPNQDYFKLFLGLSKLSEFYNYGLCSSVDYGDIKACCDQFFTPEAKFEKYMKDPEEIDYNFKKLIELKGKIWDYIIPKDVLNIIFTFFKPNERLTLSLVCKDWFLLNHEDKYWSALIMIDFYLDVPFNSFYHYFVFLKSENTINRKRILNNIQQIKNGYEKIKKIEKK